MGDFDGKTAIVTGGSLGMGKAAVGRLAAGGAAVVFCGRRQEHVAETERELRGASFEVSGVVADVANAAEMEQLVAAAVRKYGGVDVLVNSAGIQRYGTVVETDEATWDE